MIELIGARDGGVSVSVDSVLLYSRYSPKKQIQRFLREEDLSGCDLLYVVSDGFGIIESELTKLTPDIARVSIVLNPDVHALSTARFEHPTWVFGSNTPLETFLRKYCRGLSHRVARVLVWEPSARVFIRSFRSVQPKLDAHLRREAHSQQTTRVFGPRWIRNILRNARSLPSHRVIASLPTTSKPVVLLIPGPGADACLDLLSEYRDRVLLVTVSSALSTLHSSNLVSDIVVHTDPGFYSYLHFPPGLPVGNTVLCMPLTSGSPGLRFRSWFPFSNGLRAESDALRELGVPIQTIPEAGTVTATALRIADAVRENTLYVCGLDLCFHDIRSHARGHGFEPWIHSATGRIRPAEHTYFSRAVDTIPDGSGYRYAANMNVYASWIRDYMAGRKEVFRVNPSPVDLGMDSFNLHEFRLHLEKTITAKGSENYGVSLKQAERVFPEHASRRLEKRWKQLLEKQSSPSELTVELRQLMGTRRLT